MQITINQTQIERAIMDFMLKRINVQGGARMDIEMRATRGSEGFSAIIDIVDDEAEEIMEQEKARAKKVREDKLEDSGRFLKETAAKAKPVAKDTEPEKQEEAPTKEASATDKSAEAKEEPVKEEEPAKPAATTKAKSIFGKVTPA